MFDPETVELATSVLSSCRARGWHVERRIFPGDRTEIRHAAMILALELLTAEALG